MKKISDKDICMEEMIGEAESGDVWAVTQRAATLLEEHRQEIWRRTDRLFAGLLIFEWIGGIVFALCLSPRTWEGGKSAVHPHVWQALFLGLGIIVLPVCCGLLRPGKALTRHVIAVGQMLSSALLIHLGNGRVEMHFHVFGSLAFLAFYRDWRVLITATVVVATDHFLRGMYYPQSVFGVAATADWRWLEHAGWVVFEDIFLLTSCRQGAREMRTIAERQALLENSHRTVEEKVRERTEQLKKMGEMQDELLKTARSIGMAEIATSVLHNVGNVLNSVNISVNLATSKVQESPVQNLALAVQAMAEHKADLGGYLTKDAQGSQIPAYLATVSEVMAEEQKELLTEMASLSKHVEHIKQIVSVQQQYAKQPKAAEVVDIADLLEDALQVGGLGRGNVTIEITRMYAECPEIRVDKHAVLQILVNLISNAKHAILHNGREKKHLTIRKWVDERDGRAWACVEVIDNGVGIERENLTRIFTHGFTTKKEGHGFGLHASANAAKQMRGALRAGSEGPGAGASFTLELPITQEVAAT